MSSKLVPLSTLKPGDVYFQPESDYIILIVDSGEITLKSHTSQLHYWSPKLVNDRSRLVKHLCNLRDLPWDKIVEEGST